MAGKDPLTAILTGQLDKIPALPHNLVKIFICANPGEFDTERAYLTREVLPELQTNCQKYGLEVMFVDMLLGNTTDPILSLHTLEARMEEIECCFEESLGAFFLCLVGEEYGRVPLPDQLDDNEFRHIRDETFESGKNIKLLDHWYEKDDNAVPGVYSLSNQSYPSQESWEGVTTELLDVIQTAASVCHKEGRINQFHDKRQDRFFTSAFEREIKHALKLASKRCVFLFRDLRDPRIEKKASGRSFLASLSQTIKEIPRKGDRMHKLKDEINLKTSEANRLHVSMTTKDGTVCTQDDRDYSEYIAQFCSAVATRLQTIIEQTLVSLKPLPRVESRHFSSSEALVHLHHCVGLFNDKTTGNERALSKIQSLLINGARSEHQLGIIKCQAGYGKSVLAAKICYRARELFGKDAVLIPKFVGLTVGSCRIEELFRSICVQLNLVLKQALFVETYELERLTNYFHGLLSRVSKSSRHHVVVIDGLDKIQTSSELTNSQVDWLASKLPPKFHIIATCSSNESFPVLKRLESKLLSIESIVTDLAMTTEDCQSILSSTLGKAKQKITKDQQYSLMKALSVERCPYVVNVLSELARSWRSSETFNQACLPTSLNDIVTNSFDSLEKKLPVPVIKAICAYITLARYGLTEVELMDVLSCNDDILPEGFPQSQLDPVRFPAVSWVIARQTLAPVLCKRYLSGKTLLTWRFRCCSMIVRQRYLKSTEDVIKLHGQLADIFLETWSNGKPLANTEQSENPEEEEESDRILSPQPLLYTETKYNMRRMQELWYHLLKAGDLPTLKEHAFCNFEYLLAMADSSSIQEVLTSLEAANPLVVDADIHLLRLTLTSACHVLRRSPILLANELIGRLRQIKDFFPCYIDSLVSQCMEWCDSYSQPLIVPLTSWLDHVHTPFVASLTSMSEISSMVPLLNGQHVILAQDNKLTMYHMASRTHVKSFTGHRGNISCLSVSGSRWQLISGARDNTVYVWNITTGETIKTFRDYDDKPTCVTAYKGEQLLCGLHSGEIVINTIKTGKLLNTLTGHTKSITALKVNTANTILVSTSLDKKIILWYTEDWTKLNVINNCIKSPINCMDVSCDKTFILAGCDDGNLHVLSFTTGTLAQTINGRRGKVCAVVVCSDCHHCVVATANGSVCLYNFRTTELLDTFEGHTSAVRSLYLSEDQQLAFSASKEEVFVWSLLKRYTKETYNDGHTGDVTCFAVTNDNKRLITGGNDCLLKSWNLDVSDLGDNFVGHTAAVTCLALSTDKTFVVSGSRDKTLKVWSLVMASVITNYKGHTSEICGVHVLSDNRVILSLETDRKIHMWRAEDGQTVRLYEGPVNLQTPSPDSTYFISGAGDHRVQLWTLANGAFVQEFSHTEKVSCVACSADSKFMVTGSLDKSVKVWELATGKIVQIVVEHDAPILSVAMTRNDEYLLSGDADGLVMVCSLSLGQAEHRMYGHREAVTVIKLTDDDAVALSASKDHTIRVWGYNRGIQLAIFDVHAPILDIAMTATADRIAVKMASSSHVPILCLHNTPAKDRRFTHGSKESLISLTESFNSIDDYPSESNILPVRPRPTLRTRVSQILPITEKRRRLSSTSSVPQIIQHPPIKAPVQSILKAQDKKRFNVKKKKPAKPKVNIQEPEERTSSVCQIL